MKRVFIPIILVIAFTSLACNLPFSIVWNTPTATAAPVLATTVVPAVETTAAPAAATTAAPTSAPTLAGQEMNLGGIYMVVPDCLAGGASGVIEPEQNPGADMPYFAYLPAYRKITLTGYPLSGKFWEPTISVYPVAEYNTLVGNEVINGEVATLQQILASQTMPTGTSYPFLPMENAAHVFIAQNSFIHFQNGSGIGYLTELAQYYAPVNNTDLFYTYQGITADGKYWVTMLLPVNAPYLQASYDDASVPADGIPMPDMMTASEDEMKTYYSDMVAKLNSTPADTFIPSLSCIVSFIQTLNVGEQ